MAATLPLSLWLSSAGANPAGWILPGASFDVDFVNNRAYTTSGGVVLPSSLLTTVRSSTKFVNNSAGVPVSFAANALPRTNLGVLPEQAATNLVLRSAAFSQAAWVQSSAWVPTDNTVTAPDGTATGSTWTEGSNNGTHATKQDITKAASSTTYTLSLYIKASTRSQVILSFGDTTNSNGIRVVADASNGTVSGSVIVGTGWTYVGSTITPANNGWYRATLTGTSDTSTDVTVTLFMALAGALSYQGNGAGNVLVWGSQLELGSAATSYIPTTTVAVTRAADSITIPLGAWFNPALGTMLAKVVLATEPPLLTSTWVGLHDGTTANVMQLYHNSGATNPNSIVKAGSVNQFVGGVSASLTANTPYKIAQSYNTSSFAMSVNGITPNTQASGSVPSGLTTLSVGDTVVGRANNYIQRITYFPSIKNTSTVSTLP